MLLLNNSTCQSNVSLLSNTYSAIYFASLCIILFADSIFLFVGLVVQISLVKIVRSALSSYLFYVSPILHILVFSNAFIITIDDFCWIYGTISIKTIFSSYLFDSSLIICYIVAFMKSLLILHGKVCLIIEQFYSNYSDIFNKYDYLYF